MDSTASSTMQRDLVLPHRNAGPARGHLPMVPYRHQQHGPASMPGPMNRGMNGAVMPYRNKGMGGMPNRNGYLAAHDSPYNQGGLMRAPWDNVNYDRSHNHHASGNTYQQHGPVSEQSFLTDTTKELPEYREGGDKKTLTPDLAVCRIVDWLAKDEGKRKARQGLEAARQYVRAAHSIDQVPFKVWQSLDNGLFMGRLSGAVYLNWDHQNFFDHATPGQTFAPKKLQRPRDIERVAILLNPAFMALRMQHPAQQNVPMGEARDEFLATLIHQMVHAWFMRVCGRQNKGGDSDQRLKHGEGFWKIMTAIADASKSSDTQYGPNATPFGDILKRVHKPLDEDAGNHVPRHVQRYLEEECYDHSVCSTAIASIKDKSEIDAWYKKTSGAAKDATTNDVYDFDADTLEAKATPRHEKGSPSSYIEVVWEKKNFAYKRKGLEKDFDSLKQKFTDGRRVLSLPRGVDATTFRILDSFLKSGSDYKPSLSPLPPAGIPLLSGPFRKDDAQKDKLPTLWFDVRAHKLGTAMQFPELANHALARLNTQRTLRTCPLSALSEIYANASALTLVTPAPTAKLAVPNTALDTGVPADELRAWARAFMLATHPGSANGGFYASNLFVMERHCGGAGVQGLLASSMSAELEQDYGVVLTALWEKTPRSMFPVGGVFGAGGEPALTATPVNPRALAGGGMPDVPSVPLVGGGDRVRETLMREEERRRHEQHFLRGGLRDPEEEGEARRRRWDLDIERDGRSRVHDAVVEARVNAARNASRSRSRGDALREERLRHGADVIRNDRNHVRFSERLPRDVRARDMGEDWSSSSEDDFHGGVSMRRSRRRDGLGMDMGIGRRGGYGDVRRVSYDDRMDRDLYDRYGLD